MTTGIYKIENLLNGKVYIGQSVHIERRWQQHCQSSAKSLIANAIKKYGKENFSFQIVEECDSNLLNDREMFYIKQYDSLVPNGYNIEEKQEQNSCFYVKYSKDTFLQIVQDLISSDESIQSIADKYSLDVSFIYRLNRGEIHHLEDLTYPLRQVKDLSKKECYCIDCGKEIGKGATRCRSCADIAQQLCDRPTKEELKSLIRNTTFVKIGEQYGVTDNAIRKWCKGYGLPSKKKDIKQYSDEEWQKI